MNRARRLASALAAAVVIAGAGVAVLLISNARSIGEWTLIPLAVVLVLKAIDLMFGPAWALIVAVFALGLLLGRLWQAGSDDPTTTHQA